MPSRADGVVTVTNAQGASPCLLVCDHASNRMPPDYGTLGLPDSEMENHTAWDPGALEVARQMSDLLDAPLVATGVSRLVIDCNRAFDAPNLIPDSAEGKPVPGNQGLSPAERARRIAAYHAPFHAAIEGLLASRRFAAVVSVHSFTPVYFGAARPWHLGLLHDDDARLADVMLARLGGEPGLTLGRNQPYSPADGVYYTLARHGTSQGRAAVMIEIRNDCLREPDSAGRWAARLAAPLAEALRTLEPQPAGLRMTDRAEGGRLA
ncbi:MAG TPA: N-formylglutamate amidohydrolase [Thermohalobaculum sp.]|nr:N-formylglutamate amidohydrolase [Thermohalobaculum sp.]